MLRARLIASASIRWCAVQTPEILRGRILPRSGMKFCNSFTSLKSMMSTLSTQKRQTLRRRMRPRPPPRPPPPPCGLPCGGPPRPQLLGALAVFVHAHGQVAEHLVADAHAALELGDLVPRALDLEDGVDALVAVADAVGELAPAQDLGAGDVAALVGDDGAEVLRQAGHLVL